MLNTIRPGRRDFLKSAGGAASLSALAVGEAFGGQATPRSERPLAAVVGVGGRGRDLAEWQTPPFADVVAICDVDLGKTERTVQTVLKNTGRKVEVYQDYRRILDRKDIEVVVVATCDHWHTKITVDACRAGKDVYCEKPLTLTIDEGKILRKVVAETGRVVQVGTQQRSGLHFHIACNLVRNGRIGKLKQVGVIVPGGGFRVSNTTCVEEPIPERLNWDMWLGQAPARPFCRARLNFRGWWDYSGGVITDWGAHYMDIAHWGMGGEEVGPISVEAQGYNPNLGKPEYSDQFSPFSARLEYPDGVEMWFLNTYAEPRGPDKDALQPVVDRLYGQVPEQLKKIQVPDGGVLFTGTQGSIFVGRRLVTAEGIGELQDIPLPDASHVRWRADMFSHMRNFIDCVRTRQRPISYVADHHRGLIPCHMTNIALRMGRKLRWDPKREEFVGDREATALLRRTQRKPYEIAG
jgi:predicted dehydrogenase